MRWLQRLRLFVIACWKVLVTVGTAGVQTWQQRQAAAPAGGSSAVTSEHPAGPAPRPDESAAEGVIVDGRLIPLPPPSIWPAMVALGVTILMFGFVAGLIYSAAGVVILLLGLSGWIGDFHHG